jgi:hypothetical protein
MARFALECLLLIVPVNSNEGGRLDGARLLHLRLRGPPVDGHALASDSPDKGQHGNVHCDVQHERAR